MPRMFRIARCQNTLSLSMCDCRNAHILQPQSSRLAGMARKISFFAFRLAYRFLQKCRSAPIAWLALVMRLFMSMSSVRSKEMKDPKYLKWAVNLMKDPSSSSIILAVVGSCQYSASRCSAVMVLNVSGCFRALARGRSFTSSRLWFCWLSSLL